MTLKKKKAVMYGGGGRVANAIGRIGERAFLTGRHLVSVGPRATDIPAASGVAAAGVGTPDGQAKEALA